MITSVDNPSEIITKETAFGLSGSSFFLSLCHYSKMWKKQ
ncbi:hypothetical protein M067_2117 [Bacteroides fragilis str. J-143-4]|nr:hypothetical protein M067_2117 [Bacteroides fragilis str. J-143-4]EXZ94709.1 hypothetical protein M065_2829 [Bacteroides fragilis str. Korea 419]